MNTVKAERRNPRVIRKLYEWEGDVVGSLKLSENETPIPIKISSQDAREIIDKKVKAVTLMLDGKTYKVRPVKALLIPESNTIDQLDFAI